MRNILTVLFLAFLQTAQAAEPTVMQVSVLRHGGVMTKVTGALLVIPEGEVRQHTENRAEMILRDRHGVCTIKQIELGVPVSVLDCSGQHLVVLADRV